MATRSRLSILFEGLLLATLLLGLSFSSCNATSRNMGRRDLLDGAALPSGTAASTNACAGREGCQTRSTMKQDLDTMHQSAESTNSLRFMDSAAAVAKNSDPRIHADHDDNSEWVRDSEHENMNREHASLDSNTQSEDQTSMRDSDRMRENSEWMREAAHRHLSELEKMRDPRMDRMSDSERITNSADTMSDIDKRIRNPQRLRDSQRTREASQSRAEWSTEKMRDFKSDSSIKDSDRSRASERLSSGSERMRDSDTLTMDAGNVRESGRMINLDRMRDSQGMIDSHGMIASDGMRDSHNMIDSEGMRDTHSMSDSDRMRDSHMMAMNSDSMMDSDGLRDSQKMRTSQKMDTMDHERSSRHLEEMLNSESRRGSNQMMDQDRLGESAENLKNSESRTSANLGNAQDEQSEMMRDSCRARTSEGRRDLENTRDANNMMDSAVAQMHNNLDGEKGFGSEMMGDAEQMSNNLHRRGVLERMRNSDNMQRREQTSVNSHTMRNSNAARSMMGNMMEKQHSSTMEPSFCQGKDCRSTSDRHRMDSRAMEHETMPLSSRRSDAEINIGSENSEAASIDSSLAAERCSGMNAADCDSAIDGELQGSQKMHISQRNHDLSLSSCRLGGADCRMATKSEADNNPRSMETMQSTTRERMSSCSNGDCHTSIAHKEEPMAERQHRTRNDQEIVSSPKWTNLERTTSTMNEAAKRMDNAQDTSPMANQGMTRSTAAENMETSSQDGHFGSIDAERRSSVMQGSEMLHSTSNRWTGSTAEITGASSCTNGADCRSTSGIMHMSKRDSESMGHRHAQEITGRISCTNGADCRSTSEIMHMNPRDSELMGHSDEKMINGRSSCTNGADCRSISGIMHMRTITRDSEMMGRRDESEMTHTGSNWSSTNGDLTMDQEMVDDSKMMHRKSDQMNAAAEMNMHNSNEAAADNLPSHRGN